MRVSTVILAFLLTALLIHAQEPSKPVPAGAPRAATAGVPAEDAQALREDVQKMKSLIYQMQRNLASVSTAQDPLKHQFELEIEMWQLEIARLERHLNGPAETK